MQMIRLFPYLTLPLTIFVFVSVILINVGGVNQHFSTGSRADRLRNVAEKNSAFKLVNWNYSITPEQSFQSYEYHVYLNRLCSFSEGVTYSTRPAIISGYCRNDRVKELQDERNLAAPNFLVGQIHPFRFDTVNLNIPFAFYILTAICAFLLLIGSVFGGKRLRSSSALGGTVISLFAFIFIIVASGVITRQMYHLRDQIEHDTRTTALLYASASNGTIVEERWTTTVNHVSVGSVVLGLTWASVVAMLIEAFMWAFAWGMVRKERPTTVMKEEQYVQG